MMFITQFGLGEIVCTKQTEAGGKLFRDRLLKVIAIQVDLEGRTSYICRDSETGITQGYMEPELIGDPDYSQELGAYPEETQP